MVLTLSSPISPRPKRLRAIVLMQALTRDRTLEEGVNALTRDIEALHEPDFIQQNQPKTIVKMVMNALIRFICRYTDERLAKYMMSSFDETRPPPGEDSASESEDSHVESDNPCATSCHISICNNTSDDTAQKNNLFSNDIIALKTSKAVIKGNDSRGGSKMNNMILSEEALKLVISAKVF